MSANSKFPKWDGYKNLEKMKKFIGDINDNNVNDILEYAAKMTLEREYFKEMLFFVQERIQKYFETGEGLGLGIDSSKEIFEGLMLVPAEDVGFPDDKEKK